MIETEFIPSIEQQNIFDFIKKGIGNAVINAKAGSGKSTTILEGLKLIPDDKKVLMVAHNKSIANNLKNKCKRKIKDNNGRIITNILTYHALGYKILQENIRKDIVVDDYKYISQIHKNISVFSKGETFDLTPNQYRRYKSNVKKLVNYARYNKCQKKSEIHKIAIYYSLPLIGNEAETVEELLKWGKQNIKTVDFTDMIWLPYELDLKTKYMLSDWVIIDEGQDTSPIQQDLFMKCFKRNTRFIIVGDSKQCINVWCGSDTKVLENFSKHNKQTQTFPLNVSYRCPKKIIEKAQQIVPEIQSHEKSIEGEIVYDTNPLHAKNGDMILCRNLSPLAKLYTDLLKNSKKAYIKGSDIGEDIIDYIENIDYNEINIDLNKNGIISELYKILYDVLHEQEKRLNIDLIDALNTNEVMSIYDKIKTIEALSYDINTKEELIERIKNIFKDNEDEDGIMLSSVHKAKGLEADNVYILCPSLIPSKLAKTKIEQESEKNLLYVAITRAKRTLNYVSERLYPSGHGFFGNSMLLSELNNIFDIVIRCE